ncbi:hypothetical protein [Acidithiobacillus acidisediminis]|uniref:hypothetical protein n=1 Tax=Acidithiobacillus acidisediminis TaxID=2937799 RepID=UPI00200C5F5D|nr:hypothetical protein [Acidithiobacillus sp. S30A2]
MTIFFTSDWHLGHKNIIRYTQRPFSSIEEMESCLIGEWHSRVTRRDTVYFLGDFSVTNAQNRPRMEAILASLPGHKILVVGNHDDGKIQGWDEEHRLLDVRVDGKHLLLCHYPLASWGDMRNILHLHGHTHGNGGRHPGMIDVGVDVWGGRIVTLEDILPHTEPFTGHRHEGTPYQI